VRALIEKGLIKVVGRAGLDLSENGMLVGAIDELAPGDDVLVSFTFTQFRIPFNVEGRVARMLHGRRTRDRVPAIAMEFEKIDPVSRLILRGNLRRIPPVLPARARRIDYAQTVSELLAEPGAAPWATDRPSRRPPRRGVLELV
jgi:hypothetical protein